LGSSKHIIHALEAVFPTADLGTDVLPFLVAYFAEHMAINDQFFVDLVDLTVDNFVRDSFDSPLLNFIFRDLKPKVRTKKFTYIKESGDLGVLEVSSFFSAELADLLVTFLEDHFSLRDTFLFEKTALFTQLDFKVFGISIDEAGEEFYNIILGLGNSSDSFHFQKFFKVDEASAFKGEDNAATGRSFNLLAHLTLVIKLNMCLINIESSFIVITVKDFTNSSVQGSSLFYRETPFGAILLNRAALLNHNIKAVNTVAELHKGDESVSLEAIGSTQDVIKLEVSRNK
jgi:hypothetical protein